MLISQMEGYFENPQSRILEESMLFLLALKETSCTELSKTRFFPVNIDNLLHVRGKTVHPFNPVPPFCLSVPPVYLGNYGRCASVAKYWAIFWGFLVKLSANPHIRLPLHVQRKPSTQ